MQEILSIVIPTTPDRRESTLKLIKEIKRQIDEFMAWGLVTVNTYEDNKELSIGEKRHIMYEEAKGKYCWQIDSDDWIYHDAIKLILQACKQEPDCVTFQEHCDINGQIFKSNHSLSYGDWEGDGQAELWDGFHFHRTPFMKSVIKTEIAQQVPVPFLRFGEDHEWSKKIKYKLKTEVHIPEYIYQYIHQSTPHSERYGFDK